MDQSPLIEQIARDGTDSGLRYLFAQAIAGNADLCRVRCQKQQANKFYNEAIIHAQSAIVENTITSAKQHNIRCYELMTDIYQKREQTKHALEAARQALELDPDSFKSRSLVITLSAKLAEETRK